MISLTKMNLLEELSVLSYRHFSLFLFNELLASTPLEASGSTFDNPIFFVFWICKKGNNLGGGGIFLMEGGVSHIRRKYLKTITGPVSMYISWIVQPNRFIGYWDPKLQTDILLLCIIDILSRYIMQFLSKILQTYWMRV